MADSLLRYHDKSAQEPPKKDTGMRQRQKRDRHERIYKEAMQLFHEQGFSETTVMDIAKSSEISRGTFFNYYPYKEAILIEHFARRLQHIQMVTEAHENPLKALKAMFEALATFVEDNRALIPPLSYELLNPDPERSRAAFAALPLVPLIYDVLAQGRSEGLIRSDYSLERLSRTLANTYFMTALQWSAYLQERPVQDAFQKQLKLALEGVLEPTLAQSPLRQIGL